jgi:hypothetical protein
MKVFSFCLYGPFNPKYYVGMIENIHLIHKHFPEWSIFIYLGADVDQSTVNVLSSAPRVILRWTNELGAKNMIHRFFAIDEPGVELMMVRDADSRIHWRDRWAIRQFVNSSFIGHAIRDNPHHLTRLMGGLWGMRKGAGIHIRTEYEAYKHNPVVIGLAHDQDFLSVRIYPSLLKNLLVHLGHKGPAGLDELCVEFPFPEEEEFYCGKVEYVGFVDSPGPRPELTLPSNILKLSR